jgi:hypothetical protein
VETEPSVMSRNTILGDHDTKCCGEGGSQPVPKASEMGIQMDFDPPALRGGAATCTGSPVYSYVLTTARVEGETFAQYGSAPNIQDGLVTLCTHKHQMRTSLGTTRYITNRDSPNRALTVSLIPQACALLTPVMGIDSRGGSYRITERPKVRCPIPRPRADAGFGVFYPLEYRAG